MRGDSSIKKEGAGYIRASTEEQTDGFRLSVQRDEIEVYAVRNGFKLHKSYKDTELTDFDIDGATLPGNAGGGSPG